MPCRSSADPTGYENVQVMTWQTCTMAFSFTNQSILVQKLAKPKMDHEYKSSMMDVCGGARTCFWKQSAQRKAQLASYVHLRWRIRLLLSPEGSSCLENREPHLMAASLAMPTRVPTWVLE